MSMREIIWKLRDRLESLLTSLGLSLPGKVMYIGGSDTLPAPLEREPEIVLNEQVSRPPVSPLQPGDELRLRLSFQGGGQGDVYKRQ